MVNWTAWKHSSSGNNNVWFFFDPSSFPFVLNPDAFLQSALKSVIIADKFRVWNNNVRSIFCHSVKINRNSKIVICNNLNNFLCSSDCKCRNHCHSTSVKCFTDLVNEMIFNIFSWFVFSVAVSAFNNHYVNITGNTVTFCTVLKSGISGVEITGIKQFFWTKINVRHWTSGNVSSVKESCFYWFSNIYFLVVTCNNCVFNCLFNVLLKKRWSIAV